jgi:hypothetical protein
MLRVFRSGIFAVVLLAGASLGGEAAAAEDEPVVPPPSVVAAPSDSVGNITYLPGPGCPDASDFGRQFTAHLRNAAPAPSLSIRVETSELEGRAQARVTFVGTDGVSSVREISAANCREATAAAALVVALALDAPVDANKASVPAAAEPIESREPAPVEFPPRDELREARPTPNGFFWELGAGAVVAQAIAPSPMLGATAFLGLGEDDPSWDARASFVFARSGPVESDGQSAEFSLLAGQLEGCAFPIVQRERFLLEPCLALELGSVESRGADSQLYSGSSQSTLWGAAGPLLRARHSFSELWIELYGGPWIPLLGTREFVFTDPDGNRAFHDVPPVGFVAGARLALHLE